MYHESVLLKESIDSLNVRRGEFYIDCNLGGGGHTAEILKRGGIVLGIDLDLNAIDFCTKRFEKEIKEKRLIIVNENFVNIRKVANENDWKDGTVSGIIYDLGLSTFQIKEEGNGFSFTDDSAFDMRMDKSLGIKAYDLLLALSEKELTQIIAEYGEDPQAKWYAKVLKRAVKNAKRELSAKELADLIKKSSKYTKSKIHSATRVFQAFRIAVNSELENLRQSLDGATPLLKDSGRLVIISFHSLEDKIAKNLAGSPEEKNEEKDIKDLSRRLSAVDPNPISPSSSEINRNPSSRSAKMRVFEKV
ncbi:16S rRNA (cytosine(1402)-N(4))-methyltransferase [candidate division WWE3 bacterium CG_4_9_14_3_um_filter_34_6]|uniref:Ribosomal RNA small subunit methyltransferase H n=1 Tax=candidate division WWE3 bacterium CG_4_9_14_3_um_filter_34_6 TaxID=1975079 RepID=A0A2M7X5A3_UNCKA|nr:MAG: 16S rRNA (cytosine(1402)-N(4))-methyltransferase [candidate division WWE3 bacterium CG_4_9_14_3_um_filter_34_6]